jgi:DNA-directed RNA polymerase subunit N (RpoN/RPB10)
MENVLLPVECWRCGRPIEHTVVIEDRVRQPQPTRNEWTVAALFDLAVVVVCFGGTVLLCILK